MNLRIKKKINLLLPVLDALDEVARAAISTTAHYGKRKKN
jgi:hypothetical protein